MKNLEKLKGLLSLILTVLLGTMLITYSCSNDDDGDGNPVVNPLIGKYIFVSSKLISAVEVLPGVSFPVGYDMTQYVGAGLMGATPCDDQANTRLELRESGDLYYVCQGEEAQLKVGTWSSNAGYTQLTLNLSSPPLPSDLTVIIKNLIVNNSGLTGNIENLPIPISLFLDLIPEGVDPSTLPQVLIVDISVEFARAD